MPTPKEPTYLDQLREKNGDAEHFSYAIAELCVAELFEAIPKTKRLSYIGELNEVGTVLSTLWGFLVAGLDDEAKAAASRRPAREVLVEYLDRINPNQEGDTPT